MGLIDNSDPDCKPPIKPLEENTAGRAGNPGLPTSPIKPLEENTAGRAGNPGLPDPCAIQQSSAASSLARTAEDCPPTPAVDPTPGDPNYCTVFPCQFGNTGNFPNAPSPTTPPTTPATTPATPTVITNINNNQVTVRNDGGFIVQNTAGAVTATPDCPSKSATVLLGPSPMENGEQEYLQHLILAF